MSNGIAFAFICGLAGLLSGGPQAFSKGKQRPMPTASLPIEPFAGDEEILQDTAALEVPPDSEGAKPMVTTRTRTASHDLAAAVRVQMTREGFGGQLRLLEFSRPWLSVSQTLRYFAPEGGREDEVKYYERRFGLLLGAEMHPWRKARISPFLTLQAGAERFNREPEKPDLDLFLGEAAVGVELQLNRLASFSLQWAETYYAQLDERLFEEQKAGRRNRQSLEVYFTMDWETKL